MNCDAASAEVIVKSIYVNSEKYVIFGATDTHGKHIRVKTRSYIDIDVGKTYAVNGQSSVYRDDRGFSWPQIVADRVSPIRLPNALVGPWLERLPNIGETRAKRLAEEFGGALADVLADREKMPLIAKVLDPHKPRLANKIAAQIYSAMAARDASQPSADEELRFFMKLEQFGVTDVRAARGLWRLIGGQGAIDRLLRNPYLASAILSWKQADHLGKCLLREATQTERISNDHPDRVLGAVDSIWKSVLATGNTAAYPDAFKRDLTAKKVSAEEAVTLAIEKKRIVVSDDGGLYRAPGAAYLEDSLAQLLRDLEDAPSTINTDDSEQISRLVAEAERLTALSLHPEQRGAVETLLTLPVGVLQGGAGVGKTTVMKVMVSAWEALGGNVVMATLAGKAALQLMRGTSTAGIPRIAYTIARLLRLAERVAAIETGESGRNLDAFSLTEGGIEINSKTLIILDEASMIDTPSLFQLVKLLPLGARILQVGDNGQLQPIEIGCVFHDLVEEGSRVVSLSHIHRQAANSPVPAAADAIRKGRLPAFEEWAGQENGIFHINESRDGYDGMSKFSEVYQDLCKRNSDFMCIAALRKTVHDINHGFSGAERMEKYGETSGIRLGPLADVMVDEPVVCTKNRYREGLFNGLLGRVKTATPEEVRILWETEKEPRTLSREAALDIELAFAITCHRAQGSAAKYVIVLVEDSPLVTREWLYTAVTRTRETVILVGRPEALHKAVQRRSKRITGFRV